MTEANQGAEARQRSIKAIKLAKQLLANDSKFPHITVQDILTGLCESLAEPAAPQTMPQVVADLLQGITEADLGAIQFEIKRNAEQVRKYYNQAAAPSQPEKDDIIEMSRKYRFERDQRCILEKRYNWLASNLCERHLDIQSCSSGPCYACEAEKLRPAPSQHKVDEPIDWQDDYLSLVARLRPFLFKENEPSTDDEIVERVKRVTAPPQPSRVDDVLWNGVFIERQKFIREWGRRQELGEIGDDLLDTLLSFWAEVHALAAPSQDAPLPLLKSVLDTLEHTVARMDFHNVNHDEVTLQISRIKEALREETNACSA